MGWKEVAEPVLTRMPIVRQPKSHVPFKRKLLWSGGILMLYFLLTNIYLIGVPRGSESALFDRFQSILAVQQGTLLQVGIAPIVTASIVLQLLGGTDLLGLDTDDPRDQVLYQGLQKLLVVVMTVMMAIPTVWAGLLTVDPRLASQLGISAFSLELLVFSQIVVGGILILYMDEIVSKWGVGSGVGLFIIAGVSQKLVSGLFSPRAGGFFPTWFDIALGRAGPEGALVGGSGLQYLIFGEGQLLALFTTILIFAVVVYAESVRVEIPLSHSRVKGARGRFPVKLIYASVLPMILVRALQANLQFLGQILNRTAGMPSWLGVYQDGSPVAGFFYYTSPIYSPDQWMWWAGGTAANYAPWQIMLRVGIDLTVMVVGGAIFAIFWVETTDMGPESTAKQIQNSGMQIPGFRQNVGVLEKVMERYIPQVTVIGGALVGLLAVMANMLGTIGTVSGTGLLLTVSITYKLYEEIAEEQLMEMHPMMRDMFGK